MILIYFYILAEVLLFLFWSKLGGNLLVEGGKLRFEGFQLVFLSPCAGGDSLECRQIHTKFFYLFLIGFDNFRYSFFQCVQKVHAGCQRVLHGNITVIVCVTVLPLYDKVVA